MDILKWLTGHGNMIVVRFREGRDKELREWYESLPKGERSRTIRRILVEHIIISKNNIKHRPDNIKLKKANSDETDTIDISTKIDSLIKIF